MHEFNQIMVMQNDHDSLFHILNSFWSSLASLYKCFQTVPPVSESFPKHLSEIIDFNYEIIDIKKIKKDLFLPKFDITKIKTVGSLLKQYENDWNQLMIWKLAKFFYSEGDEVGKIDGWSDNGKQFFQEQKNMLQHAHYALADFWCQRYFLLDKIYMKPYLCELTMLIWLELALIKKGKEPMLGEKAFFIIVESVRQFLDDMTHSST